MRIIKEEGITFLQSLGMSVLLKGNAGICGRNVVPDPVQSSEREVEAFHAVFIDSF
jgi:hypothetical protein